MQQIVNSLRILVLFAKGWGFILFAPIFSFEGVQGESILSLIAHENPNQACAQIY
jgi:hypothetical protein